MPHNQHTEHGASINLPEWDGQAREAGEVWTLRKGTRVATCHLWTHPNGGEIRLTVDGEWNRGEAGRDGLATTTPPPPELAIARTDLAILNGAGQLRLKSNSLSSPTLC